MNEKNKTIKTINFQYDTKDWYNGLQQRYTTEFSQMSG
jgi:hypothetical protein